MNSRKPWMNIKNETGGLAVWKKMATEPNQSLIDRLLVVIILIPIGVGVITLGGWVYTLIITAILGLAAWEYDRLFRQAGYYPSRITLITVVVLLTLTRGIFQFQYSDLFLSLAVMAAMTVHLVSYEKGRNQAAVDFSITLGGILYLGWLGSYLVSLRNLADGQWWLMLGLPTIWIGDACAFFLGSRLGKHKMTARLSPKKSWEGFAAGVIGATLGGFALGALWHIVAPGILPWHGAIIGFAVALLSPLGDFGESMIKRLVGAKDSSNLIPGHGGVFDRIDSWLWACVLCYYLVQLFL
jgi:phosphatidate cytidylyltransferase